MAVTSIVSEFASRMHSLADAIRDKAHVSGAMTLSELTATVQGIEGENVLDNLIEGTAFSLSARASKVRDYAFYRHHTLQEVHLPYASDIGYQAFYDCTDLSVVDLPEATSVASSAFQSCTNLADVALPKAEYVGQNAFNGCVNLQEIDLPMLSHVESYTFMNCFDLETASSPMAYSVNTSAFYNCSALSSVDVRGARFIYSSAFMYCSELRSISLPCYSSVYNYAFASCYRLVELDLRGHTEPPSLAANAFYSTPMVNYSSYVDEQPRIIIADWFPSAVNTRLSPLYGASIVRMRPISGQLVDAFPNGVSVAAGGNYLSVVGDASSGIADITARNTSNGAGRAFKVKLEGLTPLSHYMLGVTFQVVEGTFAPSGALAYGFSVNWSPDGNPVMSRFYNIFSSTTEPQEFQMPFFAESSVKYAEFAFTWLSSSASFVVRASNVSVHEIDSWEVAE